jgi:hypothetical protein
MRSVMVDDGQLKVLVERRAGDGLPHGRDNYAHRTTAL